MSTKRRSSWSVHTQCSAAPPLNLPGTPAIVQDTFVQSYAEWRLFSKALPCEGCGQYTVHSASTARGVSLNQSHELFCMRAPRCRLRSSALSGCSQRVYWVRRAHSAASHHAPPHVPSAQQFHGLAWNTAHPGRLVAFVYGLQPVQGLLPRDASVDTAAHPFKLSVQE